MIVVEVLSCCHRSHRAGRGAAGFDFPTGFDLRELRPFAFAFFLFVLLLRSRCQHPRESPMRLKHLYYRTNSGTVSKWNCDICDISWPLERRNITLARHSGFAWLNPLFRARFRIWKRRLASNSLTACRGE